MGSTVDYLDRNLSDVRKNACRRRRRRLRLRKARKKKKPGDVVSGRFVFGEGDWPVSLFVIGSFAKDQKKFHFSFHQ